MAHGIKVQRRVHVDEICRSFICRCVYFANIGRNVEVTRIARKKKKKTGKRNTVISCPASAIGQYRKYCSGRSRALDEAEVACIFARSLTRDPDTRRRGGCPRLAR